MADDLAERIAAFLDAHHVMSLATSGAGGPHAASLFYARDGFALLWVSDPASRHSVEVAANASVAATIATDFSDFANIRGLQLTGRARRLDDESEEARARGILAARYAFLRQSADEALRAGLARAAIYRLDVVRMVLIDNSRGFAHKDVLDLAPDTAG